MDEDNREVLMLEELERATGPDGEELVLRRVDVGHAALRDAVDQPVARDDLTRRDADPG